MNANQKIIFDLSEDITAIDVIDEILKNNGLEESTEEFLNKYDSGKEPRLIIVRDAAFIMVEKKLPEKKLGSLLQKHLETSPQVAENIVKEIKEKLLPYAKKISPEENKKDDDNKINQTIDKHDPLSYIKKIEIKNVEENAKEMKKARTVIAPQTPPPPPNPIQRSKPDPYKEPIE